MLGHLLKPEYEELIRSKDWESLRVAFEDLDPADLAEILHDLPPEDSGVLFRILPRDIAGVAFEYLPLDQQAELVNALGSEQLVNVLNEMAPDDRTRLFEELPAEVTKRALSTLRPDELKVARQLLGYPDKSAGRFMTPEYMAIRPGMTAAEALTYIRANGRGLETLNVVYLTDDKGVLLLDLKLATLVMAEPSANVGDLYDRQLISIPATADREEVIGTFEKYDRVALPVTDSRGVLVGIITVDDVLDVAEEEATEDIQRMGGMEALDAPYLEIGILEMLKKRGGWLSVLFLGELLTTSAMAAYEKEYETAKVLSLFVPLIISSGGNSGSQASSLIIRSLAVREIALGDWFRVFRREVFSGLALGCLLGSLGLVRILVWQKLGFYDYGQYFLRVGTTVGFTLVCIVLYGSLMGSMLPFLLRRLGFDPATSSGPFVATLVDVSGLLIYFTVAGVVLKGFLL